MASGLLGMQVLRKELWVRVPCPPLFFYVATFLRFYVSTFLRFYVSGPSQTFLRKDWFDV